MPFDITNWDFEGYCAEQLAWFAPTPPALRFLGPESDSLPEYLKRQLVAGLKSLDVLDPRDEFWHRRHRFNRLPTMFKLGEYVGDRLRESAPDPVYGWWCLALHVKGCASPHLPEQPVWRLERPERIPTRWLIEAAWLEDFCWGDAGKPMSPVAQHLGRLEAFLDALETIDSAGDERLTSWIARERAATRAAG